MFINQLAFSGTLVYPEVVTCQIFPHFPRINNLIFSFYLFHHTRSKNNIQMDEKKITEKEVWKPYSQFTSCVTGIFEI